MSGIVLYHKVWNKHNPDNIIVKYDGNVVHHKDGDSMNNDVSNLEKMTKGEHNTLHHKGVAHQLGKKQSPEHIAKRLNSEGYKTKKRGWKNNDTSTEEYPEAVT